MSDTTHVTYDPNIDEFRINFTVDEYRNDIDACMCQYLMACRVPQRAKKDAGEHNWQLVACWDNSAGRGRNRRIGYVPSDIANLLDAHLDNKRFYADEGSWPRWDVRLADTHTDAATSKLTASVELRIYAQDYHRLTNDYVDSVFDAFDVDEVVPEPIVFDAQDDFDYELL